MQFPFVRYLRPVGDFYVALLQMCVLPFLLATIPLAVRSALTSGMGSGTVRRLALWLTATISLVMMISVAAPMAVVHFFPVDHATASRIGALFGAAANKVDMEIPLATPPSTGGDVRAPSAVVDVVPTNVFSALSSNDSLRVVIFSLIFGIGMVAAERRSGGSIFGALRHIQSVCVMIFDWLNILIPIGIVALIAPQVALLGPDVYAILAPFLIAFLATSLLLVFLPVILMAIALRANPLTAFILFLKPLAMVAATRNALVCAPMVLDTMKEGLKAKVEPCELYIPIGFAVMRFGYMVHFVIATLFLGHLMGRIFSGTELVLMASFAVMASFATIGVSGIAGLAPMAAVLRPFGLSYELALPLMAITDPLVSMVRGMLNVMLNSQIPALAAGRRVPTPTPTPTPTPALALTPAD